MEPKELDGFDVHTKLMQSCREHSITFLIENGGFIIKNEDRISDCLADNIHSSKPLGQTTSSKQKGDAIGFGYTNPYNSSRRISSDILKTNSCTMTET